MAPICPPPPPRRGLFAATIEQRLGAGPAGQTHGGGRPACVRSRFGAQSGMLAMACCPVNEGAGVHDQDHQVVFVLQLVWKCQPAATYELGCVYPGDHNLSWRKIWTSVRHQIISLCRLTRDFRQLWQPDHSPSRPPPRYNDMHGCLEVHGPSARPWKGGNWRACPECNASWPVRRWAWAREGFVARPREEGVVDYRGALPRENTYCASTCRRPLFCPDLTVTRVFLRQARAPRWVEDVYRLEEEEG